MGYKAGLYLVLIVLVFYFKSWGNMKVLKVEVEMFKVIGMVFFYEVEGVEDIY